MTSRGTTQKYLARYAEPTAASTKQFFASQNALYRSVVCIPAYDESFQGVRRVVSRIRGEIKRLVILVLNEPSDAPSSARLANERLKAELLSVSSVEESVPEAGLSLCKGWSPEAEGLDLLLIDARHSSLKLGPREGVGRARKMGLDAALALCDAGVIESQFLGSTDADVVLPEDYFSQLEATHGDYSALLFSYQHISSDNGPVPPEMQAVEAVFRYYVLGLSSAGSPYAYHSLGSTLAVNASRYAQVRGVPNRQAGEDFYLLAKLGKLAPMLRLPETVVEILTRHSSRVPFGTGPSLAAAEEQCRQGDELLSYHPRVFAELSDFLELSLALARRPELSTATLRESGASDFVVDEASVFFLALKGAYAQCPSSEHRCHRFHERFDSLATLQFIHRLEASGVARLPLLQALREAPFLKGLTSLSQLAQREASLTRLTGAAAHTETVS